jgi:uncharacterized membrane protein
MTDGMLGLSAAALFFVGTHFALSSTGLRGSLVARIGERGFLALYSLIALVAIVWLVRAYAAAPHVELWPQAPWTRWVPLLVLPLALLLIVGAFSAPNPSAIGQDAAARGERPVRGVLTITRNPFLWAAGLWALAHLCPNGDLASVVFFGAFAVLALVGSVLVDAKMRRRLGPEWTRIGAHSSNVPFVAVLQGRTRLALGEIGWSRLAAAGVLYVTLLAVHPWLFGVSPLPA